MANTIGYICTTRYMTNALNDRAHLRNSITPRAGVSHEPFRLGDGFALFSLAVARVGRLTVAARAKKKLGADARHGCVASGSRRLGRCASRQSLFRSRRPQGYALDGTRETRLPLKGKRRSRRRRLPSRPARKKKKNFRRWRILLALSGTVRITGAPDSFGAYVPSPRARPISDLSNIRISNCRYVAMPRLATLRCRSARLISRSRWRLRKWRARIVAPPPDGTINSASRHPAPILMPTSRSTSRMTCRIIRVIGYIDDLIFHARARLSRRSLQGHAGQAAKARRSSPRCRRLWRGGGGDPALLRRCRRSAPDPDPAREGDLSAAPTG